MERTLDRNELITQARADLAKLITPGPVGEPLMVRLAMAVGSSTGFAEGGTASAANASNLLNLGASKMLTQLREAVAAEVSLPAATAGEGVKLSQQMGLMLAFAEADRRGDEALKAAATMLATAVEAITELLEPTPEVVLRGVTCPACGGGHIVLRAAAATCQADGCEAVWEGESELRMLAAQDAGSTVVALDAERKRREGQDAAVLAAQALRAA